MAYPPPDLQLQGVATPLVSSLVQINAVQGQQIVENGPETQNYMLIDLTREQLLQAGYQSKKRLWSEEQDKHLKMLVKKHGKNWDVISNFILGRNSKMCYSRYKRLKCSTRQVWKNTENQKLVALIQKYGKDWRRIGNYFERRTPKQIKEHYMNFLKPEIVTTDWTLEDDLKLIEIINTYGIDWPKVKAVMTERSQMQIKNRYFNRLKKLMDKKNEQNPIS